MCRLLPVPANITQVLFHNASDLLRVGGEILANSRILSLWMTNWEHSLGIGPGQGQSLGHLH